MSDRIRVLQLFYTFDVEVGGGGLSLFAIELGKKLDPTKFEVSLCSLGYYDTELGKARIERLNEEGIKSFEATKWDDSQPYQSFLKAWRTLRQELSENPVDILHSHSEYTDVTAIMLKAMRKVPHILRTVHYGFHEEWNRKPLRRLMLTNFSYPLLFDTEIGINNQNTERLNHRFMAKLLNRHAIRIPNAISFDRFQDIQINQEEKKKSLGIPAEALVVGTVGRLADQKGYCYLIEAANLILQKEIQVYFLIIGDGPLAEEHKEQAERLGIADKIIFTGGRTDVEELLHCMDLFASSSLWEGLPTVLLEAMAVDVPIVATDIPGTNELISHQQNGLLVKAYSPESLADGINELLHSPELRVKLAKNARKTVRGYSIDSIAERYEALYQKMIRKR